MGFVGKLSSVLATGLFLWWTSRIAIIGLQLFYPTTHIPLLNPQPEVRPGALVNDLAWKEPFEYAASMYVSTMETFVFEPEKFLSTSELVWHIPPQSLGQRYPRFSQRLRIPLPESVRATNGTGLYAFLFVQNAATFTPDPDFNDKYSVFARAPLVSIRQREIDRKHLLLGKDKEAENHKDVAADRENEPWVPHAKTRLQWEIVLEDNTFYDWRMPLDLVPFMRVQKNVSSKHHPYAPLAWENPLAVYAKHWVPLTNQSAVSESTPLDAEFIDVDVRLAGVVLGWFRLCNYASQGMKELTSSRSLIHYTETDVDNLKEMVYEVNPLMLAITLAAMALHLLFEFLAYKEDVAFWSNKSKDSIQGISRSSMLMGLASSWLSFLYMWDRRKETSVVVIAGAAVGAVVEAWKVSKVFSARDIFSAIKGKPVSDTNRQHAQQSPQDKDTSEAAKRGQVQREVDQQTAWYMVRVCIPVMAAYATYSLLYQKHESYVSWFLNISLITVYSLEFVQMWPQLLINHKLKTVDMLPLTAFLYRFLRTFIDDLFALVVPMPLIERIGTLRDDVVFVVLCYQWFRFPRRKSPPEHSVNDKDNDKEKKKKTE